ncbi:FadR family transcriptional regulator [Oceanicola sp. D3]|uniref:FadR/GntR family transcriptional regulator n=1 Tax=Oceanicola sp. D3 TaxID=2587163 RepID=UPI0011249E4B|nr:FadR/GntR family transcriptional regulator [Oceanicola sp. D3]QDC11194.1 FadR family transcriptional regulator [Oceanicola sp. D3]
MDTMANDGAARGETVRAGRLESEVYERLLEQIRSGHYTLGEKLPAEKDLSAEHGVSRPVIRSALARLREDGLIVSRQGAGSFVSGGGQSGSDGYAPLQSIDDIASYIEFRKMLEVESAGLAALKAGPEEVVALEAMLVSMEKSVRDKTSTIEMDARFHVRIAELSDNRFLLDTLQMLRSHMFFIGKFVRSLGVTGYRQGKISMVSEHRRIFDGIAAGDPEAARKAMAEHIEASERRVFKGE